MKETEPTDFQLVAIVGIVKRFSADVEVGDLPGMVKEAQDDDPEVLIEVYDVVAITGGQPHERIAQMLWFPGMEWLAEHSEDWLRLVPGRGVGRAGINPVGWHASEWTDAMSRIHAVQLSLSGRMTS